MPFLIDNPLPNTDKGVEQDEITLFTTFYNTIITEKQTQKQSGESGALTLEELSELRLHPEFWSFLQKE